MIYFLWLGLGVVVEGAVLQFALRRSLATTALYALLINGITHPLAWWAVQSGTLGWWLTESLVVVIETALIALAFQLSPRRAFVWSLIANAASAAAGMLLSIIL